MHPKWHDAVSSGSELSRGDVAKMVTLVAQRVTRLACIHGRLDRRADARGLSVDSARHELADRIRTHARPDAVVVLPHPLRAEADDDFVPAIAIEVGNDESLAPEGVQRDPADGVAIRPDTVGHAEIDNEVRLRAPIEIAPGDRHRVADECSGCQVVSLR